MLSVIGVIAQEKIPGHYHDYLTDALEINADSTFNYTFRFDLVYSWSKGMWKASNDTIYFKTVLIFDTISYKDEKTQLMADSLFLSVDERSNRGFDSFLLTNRGKSTSKMVRDDREIQNTFPAPEKLFFRKNRLYGIYKNGKLSKGKVQSIITQKKYPAYFIKISDDKITEQ